MILQTCNRRFWRAVRWF